MTDESTAPNPQTQEKDLDRDNPMAEIQGASQLTIEAVIGVTDLVESLHHTINTLGGLMDPLGRERTSGITGLVYSNIRSVTRLVGTIIDGVLDKLTDLLGDIPPSNARAAVISALNGVVGDHLAEKKNPLAIKMGLHHGEQSVEPKSPYLIDALAKAHGNLLLMVHGACMSHQQWNWRGVHDHGAALAADLGFCPVYLRYNSGLHVSQNGTMLTELLEQLATGYKNKCGQPLAVNILAFSMGGLVARSACYYAKESSHTWLSGLKRLITLGTPHHGAPLERYGNWVDILLGLNNYTKPFSRLGKIRSAGITDLRHGNLVHEDWQGRDRFEHTSDTRKSIPLPHGVSCFTAAASTIKGPVGVGDRLVGDGLVTVQSALGQHREPHRTLQFPEDHKWIGRHMTHLDLLTDEDLYAALKNWLKS